MDKWTAILLDAEAMWEKDSYAQCLGMMGCDPEKYAYERDCYKAERIYSAYGYDYFLRFIQEYPRVAHLVNKYLPCDQAEDGQCTLFCYFYGNGGCKHATTRMD
jgi:hypothetical protein